MKHAMKGFAVMWAIALASFGLSYAIAQTVSVPLQTITVTIPAQTVTITVPAQTIPVIPAPVVTPPPVVVTTPPPGIAWGYTNGVFLWAGDFNNAATANYADKVGLPGGTDISITLKGAWGEWLPYMSKTFSYPTTGYTKLVFQLKPTVANQKWDLYFIGVGDVSLGASCGVDVLKYGPAPQVGVWASYSVPLADLCVLGKSVYKFGLQDKTGLAVNTWYVYNVGFAP